MKLTLNKLHNAFLTIEYKWAGTTGNTTAQQTAIEKMVLLHTRMRVEQEQYANKLLFNNH